MTNKDLYGMIPSAIVQLRQRRLSFAGHCYRCEDIDVKISLSNIWSCGRAKLAKCAVDKATASHTSNNCCVILAAQTIDELQPKMKNGQEWSKISHSSSE